MAGVRHHGQKAGRSLDPDQIGWEAEWTLFLRYDEAKTFYSEPPLLELSM